MLDGLSDRFPNMSELEAFSLFDPQKLPSEEEELTKYGERKLEILHLKHATGDDPDEDSEACSSEWESLRQRCTATTLT